MQKNPLIVAVVAVLAVAAGGAVWYKQQGSINNAIQPQAGEVAAPVADVTAPAATPAAPEQPAPETATPAAVDTKTLKASDVSGITVTATDAKQPRVMGSVDAPITLIEYSSFSCPHCAHFHDSALPTILRDYVATGKVKIIFADFPLNREAMDASLLARCVPTDKFLNFTNAVFENIGTWVENHPTILKQYAGMSGLDSVKIDSCLQDKAVEDAIVAGIKDASGKYKIDSTPTFVINEKDIMRGGAEAADFAAKFDALLASQKAE